MDEYEDGEESIAESMGAAIARAAGEQKRRIRSGEGMLGSAARRERRPVFAIATLVFVLGFAVSTTLVSGEQSSALDGVIQQGYDQAETVSAGFTAKDLAKPITGPTYERLAATTWKSVSSTGTVTAVRVWSTGGKILFSLNKSRVGASDPEMKPVLARASEGSDWYRVLDETIHTFTPVSMSADGPVYVVEIDQPMAAVDARVGDFWKQLRFGFALALIVSLVLLVLTFFTPAVERPRRSRGRAARMAQVEIAEDEMEEAEPVEPEAAHEPQAEVEPKTPAEKPAAAVPAAASAAQEPAASDQPASYREVLRALHQTEDLVLEPEPAHIEEEAAPVVEAEPAPVTAEAEPAPTVQERVQAAQPEAAATVHDDAVPAAPVEAVDPKELLRRRVEEFKARAEQAGLRRKQTDPELQEAAATPKSEQ
jgi:hypothetical protein